ncbi:hypothetical protein WJ62_12070 [Burkholderia diffusa]|nr:hypothetical protein WJ62_12070 [Burkholderia diffusa]
MRCALAATALAALLCHAQNAFSRIDLGGFRLGEDKGAALVMANERIGPAQPVHAERYQVSRDFYEVTPRKSVFQLCGAPVTTIRMYFDANDKLNQVDLSLDTADREVIRCLVPDADKAKPTGSFGDTWEIEREDGEIVCTISKRFNSAMLEFADRHQADVNSLVRKRSDERFKKLDTQLEGLVEQMKDASKPIGQ